MKFAIKLLSFLKPIGVILIFSLLLGCSQPAKKGRSKSGTMDTPAFHVSRGDDALLSGQYDAAVKSFNQALSLDPAFSPAQSGLAVAKAYLVARPSVSDQSKSSVLKEAEALLDKALEGAGDHKSTLIRTHNSAIQVYVALQLPKEDWYDKVIDHYKEAESLDPNDSASHFFSARAHAVKLNYPSAVLHYKKVLEIGKKYEEEANRELKRIQRVQRALPGSQFGASVANVREISRADVAALFIAELRLDRIYQSGNTSSSSFSAPKTQQKMRLDPLQKYPEAVDISGHPMERAILEIIKYGVKGLEPDPAHKFYPDQKIKRAEFSLMVQDILVKVTKNSGLETQFMGQASPFPDVRSDAWFYNATRTVVNRGLMSVNNKVTGDFEPFGSVSGADALLTIRNLKEILKSYLR